jgi:hypothetical protein
MPGVSSDYNLAAIYSTLPGRRHPPRTGSLTTHHATLFFHKPIPWACPKGMNGMLESVSSKAGRGVFFAKARMRSKVAANMLDFSHAYKIRHSIAIVEYSRNQGSCKKG